MAFVSGMMGYICRNACGASIAMMLSLFVAFNHYAVFGFHLLKSKKTKKNIKKEQGLKPVGFINSIKKIEQLI